MRCTEAVGNVANVCNCNNLLNGIWWFYGFNLSSYQTDQQKNNGSVNYAVIKSVKLDSCNQEFSNG